jgi:CubicO group peptidase (beta-lactamase class C family)
MRRAAGLVRRGMLALLGGMVAATAGAEAQLAVPGPLFEERAITGADILRAAHQEGAFPGAVLLAGHAGKVVMRASVGSLSWTDPLIPREDETVYDVASLTKVVATTPAIMLLVEDGRLSLDDRIMDHLPETFFSGREAAWTRITIRNLLAHDSGLPAWAEVRGLSPDAALARIFQTPLLDEPGVSTRYSDLGFVLLWEIAERATREPLPLFLERRLFRPLGMHRTGFLPPADCRSCAPTMIERDGREIRGIVHDPIARTLGGVAGNAGLFSTAADLGRFAQMMLNRGALDGRRVLRGATIDHFTREVGSHRALGWETPSANGGGSAGQLMSGRAYGHTGFTGTSLWIDPQHDVWILLLTNRTYEPQVAAPMQRIRRAVHDHALNAIRTEMGLPSVFIPGYSPTVGTAGPEVGGVLRGL